MNKQTHNKYIWIITYLVVTIHTKHHTWDLSGNTQVRSVQWAPYIVLPFGTLLVSFCTLLLRIANNAFWQRVGHRNYIFTTERHLTPPLPSGTFIPQQNYTLRVLFVKMFSSRLLKFVCNCLPLSWQCVTVCSCLNRLLPYWQSATVFKYLDSLQHSWKSEIILIGLGWCHIGPCLVYFFLYKSSSHFLLFSNFSAFSCNFLSEFLNILCIFFGGKEEKSRTNRHPFV